jgi:hypothetical protein
MIARNKKRPMKTITQVQVMATIRKGFAPPQKAFKNKRAYVRVKRVEVE